MAYVVLGLSSLNFLLCCIVCQCISKLFQHRLETALEQRIPPQTITVPPQAQKICMRCDKPVNLERQVAPQAHNQERRGPSNSQS